MATQLRFLAQQTPSHFLELPWATPLETWEHPKLLRIAPAPSRHIVRFVSFEEQTFTLKEMPERDAEREYSMLRQIRLENLPVVEVVGLVSGRQTSEGEPLDGGLITRFLDYSLPFRYLFGVESGPVLGSKLIDAAVVLLVRLHVEGFYWGDCSLSNLLFRRDAGALMAYLVDAETSERHSRPLPDRMREVELDLARENFAGGLLDLQAEGRLSPDIDIFGLVNLLGERYTLLWDELTEALEIDARDKHLIDQRIRRINELGFDVDELVVESHSGGDRLRVVPTLLEEGHHTRELRRLTGLVVQENQARRLLNDLASFGAYLSRTEGRSPTTTEVAARWLADVYEPLVGRIPDNLRGRLEPPELFHEMLEHRYYLSEKAGNEVDNDTALRSYIDTVLRHRPSEQALFPRD